LSASPTDSSPTGAPKDSPLKAAFEFSPVSKLRPDGQNAHTHSKKQIAQIARSIRTFGFLVPMVVDADGQVICGHGRLAAALQLGMTEVPVVRVEHLAPAQIRAFQIADNRLTENATWDRRLLGEAFRDLSLLDLDFDLEITGFEVAEIDLIVQGLDEGDADLDDEPLPCVPHVTRPGDLWEVLGHKIFCGDALLEASYSALMANELAAATITDPGIVSPICTFG
jgi:hypothetical protein